MEPVNEHFLAMLQEANELRALAGEPLLIAAMKDSKWIAATQEYLTENGLHSE